MRRILLPLFFVCTSAFSQPASMAGFSDQGAFTVYVNEEKFGRFTFTWKSDGAFTSDTKITYAGQTVGGTLTITPDSEGRWMKAVAQDSKKHAWERKGEDYKFTFPDNDGTMHGPPDMLTFETWTPPLMSLAFRRFDKSGDARQTMPVVVLDSDYFKANLEVERTETFERSVRGGSLKLTRWIYAPPGREYHALADAEGRVFRADGFGTISFGIPGKNIVFVREGYEELLRERGANGPDSQPRFEVDLKTGVGVPMRDGLKLATDLYLPVGAAKAPVILVRTPYKKENWALQGRYYARRGYAVAVEDVRGRFASPGVWEPFLHEAKDGYDAVEWVARQTWSSGKVGMIGASYVGWVQLAAASLHPPHLAALIPNVSPPDPFHNLPFESGALWLQGAIQWSNRVDSNETADLSGATEAGIEKKDWNALLKPLPVSSADKAVLGKELAYWAQWMAHPVPDRYWADAMFSPKLKNIGIPVFHQSGWFDGDGVGTKLNYLAVAASGRGNQKLTVGPWDHTDTASRLVNNRDYGAEADVDLQREYLRWFDHWLKGIENGVMQEPRVSLFLMGENRWLHGDSYPLPQTQYQKLYLTSGGHANTSSGDGQLSFQAARADQPADRYVYDPGDPTPEPDQAGREKTEAERKDILVYTSAPFEKPYTIAGPVSAVLYAATSARDTDWFVHVVELDEEGKPLVLWSNGSGGHIRARYRKSLAKPELLQPGKVYRYEIDLWHTGVTIAAGHRLRVEVSSAAFPLFERNLNTGGSNETETKYVAARQTVYHDVGRASYVLLPMIPER